MSLRNRVGLADVPTSRSLKGVTKRTLLWCSLTIARITDRRASAIIWRTVALESRVTVHQWLVLYLMVTRKPLSAVSAFRDWCGRPTSFGCKGSDKFRGPLACTSVHKRILGRIVSAGDTRNMWVPAGLEDEYEDKLYTRSLEEQRSFKVELEGLLHAVYMTKDHSPQSWNIGGTFTCWSTFSESTADPFDYVGLVDDSRSALEQVGLVPTTHCFHIVLRYELPRSVPAFIPTIAEAHAGNAQNQYFRPAPASETRWGRAVTPGGTRARPEIVHDPIAPSLLTHPFQLLSPA